MINLDQVRTLEWKVKQAVQLIVHLRRENDTLRSRLSDTEVRLQELETLLESFKATQNEMESGIRSALEDLDNLEVGAAPSVPGPVDSLNYPPESASTTAFAEEDPAAVFDKAPVATFAAEDPAALVDSTPEPTEPAREMTFEEEYAALAAAEAESGATSAPVPESVELEESVDAFVSEDESAFLDSEPAPTSPTQPVQPEEKQPEQPGLGIF
jgi:FtsZ-binding cell division protein ZapB